MTPAGAAAERPLVLIVDDDEEVRTAIQELMHSVDIDACCFSSTREVLEADLPERSGCMIVDIGMPGSTSSSNSFHSEADMRALVDALITVGSDLGWARMETGSILSSSR